MPRRSIPLLTVVLALAAASVAALRRDRLPLEWRRLAGEAGTDLRDAPRSLARAVRGEFEDPWPLWRGAERWGWLVAMVAPSPPRSAAPGSSEPVSVSSGTKAHAAAKTARRRRPPARPPHQLRTHVGQEGAPPSF